MRYGKPTSLFKRASRHLAAYPHQSRPPDFSWKLLLSGYVPEYVYEQHRLDTRLPFDEPKRRSHINARARASGGYGG